MKTIKFLVLAVLVFIASCSCPNSCNANSIEKKLKDAHIWVLAGQSNMQGCGMFKEPIKLDENIIMLNMDNTWMTAQNPLHRIYDSNEPIMKKLIKELFQRDEKAVLENRAQLKNDPQKAFLMGVGVGTFFAKHLRKEINKPIALIPCAVGGTSMKHWDPNLKNEPNGSLYKFMLDRIKLAGGRIDGVLWSQGESDSGLQTSMIYEQVMLNFIDALRKDTGIDELPFLIIQTGKFATTGGNDKAPDWERVREAQRRLMSLRPNIFVVSGMDMPLDDPIHVSFEAYQKLGVRLGEIALTEVYNKKGHAKALDIESLELIDPNKVAASPCFGKPNIFKLKCKNVNGGFADDKFMAGFEIRNIDPNDKPVMFYKAEADKQDKSAILLYTSGVLPQHAMTLIYGSGISPYVNVEDKKMMSLPAFGPVNMPTKNGEILKY